MVLQVFWVLFCVIGGALSSKGSREDGALFLNNLFNEGSIAEAECDAAVQAAVDADRRTLVDPLPKLRGQWVSQRCEVDSGPDYVLRSLTFQANNTFKYLVFHYSDASCTASKFTLLVEGQLSLLGPSWTTSGASQSEVIPQKVSIVSHTQSVGETLTKDINKTCPGFSHRRWKRRKEYVLYSKGEVKKCYEIFAKDLEALTLTKTQTRIEDGRRTRELLTRAAFSEPLQPILDSMPLFNTPLIHTDQRHGCSRCHIISRGTEKSPPHLMELPRLPPYLAGEWVSPRCEALPMGAFLTRRLTFGSADRSWNLRAGYFSDPSCTDLSFSINAAGFFSKGGIGNESKIVDGAYDLDLTMLQVKVTVQDRALRTALDREGCTGHLWDPKYKKGRQSSCLGIRAPFTTYSIVHLEIDFQGEPQLFLGQVDVSGKRATSYQSPLIQCSALADMPQALPLFQDTSSSAFFRSTPPLIISILVVSINTILCF